MVKRAVILLTPAGFTSQLATNAIEAPALTRS
jgi:hypothetical protein